MAVQEINSADKLLNIFRREIWTKKNTIFVPFLTSLVLLNKVEILNGISVLQESGPKGLATILEGEKYDYMYFFCNYLFLPLLSAFFIQISFVLFKVLLSSVDFRLDKTIYKLGVENTLNLKLKGENEKLEISLTKAETEAERLRNREEAFDGLTFSNLKIWSGIRVDHITYKFTKSNGSNGGISQESVRWNFGKEIGILESPFDPDNPNTEQRKVAYDLNGC